MHEPRRPELLILLLAALAVACGRTAPAPASEESSPDLLVFRNFTLIDGTDQAPVSGAGMIVDAGRITWVGPAAELQPPEGATARDLGGAFVIPGLINLHGHVGNTVDLKQDRSFHTKESIEKDLQTYAAYGVTTVLSMGTDQDTIFEVRDEQHDGRPSMARVYTAGQGLVFEGGYGGLTGVNEPVSTPDEAEAAVRTQADKQVDVIKLWLDSELGTMPKMPPAISQRIIETAHRRNLRAVAHVFYLEDAKRLVNQGIDALVHSVRDRPVDQALIDGMLANNVWQAAATLSREASMFAYGSTPAFASDPFFTRAVSAASLELIKSPERQKTIASGPHFKEYPAFLETAKANLKRLADAGVPYGFGTDAGPPGRFPGYFEHWELQLMVEAGLTPQQALSAATQRAAEFLYASELGTLEAGKWADMIVLDADPLADIRNSRTIRTVYVAGREVPSINKLPSP
jgi:imidazolonepropionase-like amidohydrolase